MAIVLNGKTYDFIGFDQNGVATWQETSGDIPSSFGYLTCRVTRGGSSAETVVRWRLTMPIVAASDSACCNGGKVLRIFRYDEGKVTVPSTSTAAERTDFRARILALTGTAQYVSSILHLVAPSN